MNSFWNSFLKTSSMRASASSSATVLSGFTSVSRKKSASPKDRLPFRSLISSSARRSLNSNSSLVFGRESMASLVFSGRAVPSGKVRVKRSPYASPSIFSAALSCGSGSEGCSGSIPSPSGSSLCRCSSASASGCGSAEGASSVTSASAVCPEVVSAE